MSFIVDDDPKFTRTVKVKTPVGTGCREETVDVTFRAMDVDEAATFNLRDGGDVSKLLRRVVVSMGDLVTRDGEPIAYSDQLRDQLILRSPVRNALIEAYTDAVTGAELGN